MEVKSSIITQDSTANETPFGADGTYLFTVPGSVYWISQRYKIPILTIVLNNKGTIPLAPAP